MATTIQPSVSVEQYLKTTYHPDCDYVDGVLEERNLGEPEHAEVQGALVEWFRNHGKEWNIRALPEARIQITPSRFRVADVGVYSRDYPVKQIRNEQPLLVIEVISPEDRISRYEQRIKDYRSVGVRHIWVIDPQTQRGYDCSTGSWIEKPSFAIENSAIAVDLSVIFAELG
jgi:Uma2 family endonuclease